MVRNLRSQVQNSVKTISDSSICPNLGWRTELPGMWQVSHGISRAAIKLAQTPPSLKKIKKKFYSFINNQQDIQEHIEKNSKFPKKLKKKNYQV